MLFVKMEATHNEVFIFAVGPRGFIGLSIIVFFLFTGALLLFLSSPCVPVPVVCGKQQAMAYI